MDSWTRFAESLFRLNGLLIAAGDGITRPIGQSSARWQVLGGLGYGPQTVADLARSFGHARQSVQRVVNALIEEGLVAQRPKEDDRRTFLLEMTADGRAVLARIYARQMEWSDRFASGLDSSELEILAKALRRIGDSVAEDTRTEENFETTPPG